MFERIHNAEEALHWQLGSALKMERTILEMLDGLSEQSREQTLRTAFRAHQAETRDHIQRVEEAFARLGWEVDDSPCPAVDAIEKEARAKIKKADDSVVDSILVGGAIETEHHELAVYENLILGARALGRDDVASLLERNCDEERQTLRKVRALGERIARSVPQAASL
jgi:ferritin-like metal-binding protein YciE